MTTRRQMLIASGVLLTVAALSARAQQPGRTYRIGFLRTAAPPDAYIEAFRQGLKELGYIEGKNVVFEYRWAGGKSDRLAGLATELIALKVDVIVTDGASPARYAQSASPAIAVVMASVGDPVDNGLIASLGRPGGNVTGLTSMNFNLGGKSLDVLKDIVPKLEHVGVLSLLSRSGGDVFIRNTQMSAQALKIRLTTLMVRGPDEYENGFRAAVKDKVQALIVGGTPQTSSTERKQIIELAAKHRLPAIYDTRDWVDNGGLISYGADRVAMYHRAASFVDKIFRGTKPAELPIEQPTKFELVINLRSARNLGMTIPQSVLVRADKVIE